MIIDSLVPDVQGVAPRYDLDWKDLAALIDVESSGGRNTNIRVEQHKRDFSIGPGQVLTATAVWMLSAGYIQDDVIRGRLQRSIDRVKEQGIRLLWHEMERPETSIELAAAYLAYQSRRYRDQDIHWAISAYNAGTARVDYITGKFRNQEYVDKWATARQEYLD